VLNVILYVKARAQFDLIRL